MAVRGSKEWKENIRSGVKRAYKEGAYTGVDYSKTPETREKIAASKRGKTYEQIFGEENGKKMREKRKEQLLGNKRLQGKRWKLTSEQRLKHSFKRTTEQRMNYRTSKIGEKNPAYFNGECRRPYPYEFNKELKQFISSRDDNMCQYCFEETDGEIRGCPHHIDYNKENNSPSNLVWVCTRCNSKFNSRREHWKKYWINFMLETGKCGLFPDEKQKDPERPPSETKGLNTSYCSEIIESLEEQHGSQHSDEERH